MPDFGHFDGKSEDFYLRKIFAKLFRFNFEGFLLVPCRSSTMGLVEHLEVYRNLRPTWAQLVLRARGGQIFPFSR